MSPRYRAIWLRGERYNRIVHIFALVSSPESLLSCMDASTLEQFLTSPPFTPGHMQNPFLQNVSLGSVVTFMQSDVFLHGIGESAIESVISGNPRIREISFANKMKLYLSTPFIVRCVFFISAKTLRTRSDCPQKAWTFTASWNFVTLPYRKKRRISFWFHPLVSFPQWPIQSMRWEFSVLYRREMHESIPPCEILRIAKV